MLKVIFQYIRMRYVIKIAKIQGYEGVERSNLCPKTADLIKAKGYKVSESTFLRNSYLIKW